MVTLFLRQGENGKQVLLSFPATTPAEKADVAATMEGLKSMSKTVTIQGAASEVMNLGLYLSGVDLAARAKSSASISLPTGWSICRRSTVTNSLGCWMQTASPARKTFRS